ncbi:hypothetical protein [Nonomuraea sp. CA-141351]|uniref:hypothetical protein n=1 Tax=Nonomuraea sp. CA-141351 TaxID=3239996 RepID=UPI003D8FA2C2
MAQAVEHGRPSGQEEPAAVARGDADDRDNHGAVSGKPEGRRSRCARCPGWGFVPDDVASAPTAAVVMRLAEQLQVDPEVHRYPADAATAGAVTGNKPVNMTVSLARGARNQRLTVVGALA